MSVLASYKKDINLLDAMTKKKSRVNPLALIVPIFVFLVLGAGIALSTFWITSQTVALTLERDSLQNYMTSSRVTEGQQEAQTLQAQVGQLQALASEVRGTLYNLSSYPDLTGEDFQAVFEMSGEDIELTHFMYDRRTGVLSFTATCESVRKIPVFVTALRDSGIFSDVQYKGYANETRTESGNPILDPVSKTTTIETWTVSEYHYDISCLVANPAPTLPALEEESAAEGDTEEGSSE